MEQQTTTVLNASALELHYWFNDNSHTMNAFIQNRCELEFLGIISEIAAAFGTEIVIETEPFGDGGIIPWIKIKTNLDERSSVLKVAIVTALVTGVLVTPITTALSKGTEALIEKIFEDEAKTNRATEKEKLELEELKLNVELKRQLLHKNMVISKKKSNFYEILDKYPKVTQVSIVIQDKNRKRVSEENFVRKDKFKEFILVTDKLEPDYTDNAIIEIISPVLKKGDYKWRGIYNGETVSFTMKSNEFKALVQTGKIEFKNGSSINCLLKIDKKMNNEGIEQISGYTIKRVNNYFENETPIETPEGKIHRQKREADESQYGMFD
jgi:hypothetical protein